MPRFSLRTFLVGVSLIAISVLVIVRMLPVAPMVFDHEMKSGTGTYNSFIRDKRIGVKIPESHGPRWLSSERDPPLSAKEAIRLAIAKRKSILNASKDCDWVLQRASLVPADAKNGYWYWMVVFCEEFQGDTVGDPPPNLRLVVMMDGTVIEPNIEKYR